MSQIKQIPFLDLVSLHADDDMKSELCDVFKVALDTGSFIGGPMVEGFERDFGDYCDAKHCIGVSSGTDALRFALIASGVGKGHTVVTAPNSFIATAEAITQAGARPVFVDIDEETYNLDPARLLHYLETVCEVDVRTKRVVDRRTNTTVTAIVPVHLYGQMADMDPILEIAERYGLSVIEDACQAHGAEYFSRRANKWRVAGSMGRAAAFSFYPGKNLGAFGEAGAVTTDDDALAQEVRILRNHGQAKKYHHEIEGYNGRLDSIQAGILRVKLRHLSRWNEQRRECARIYDQLFDEADRGLIRPYVPEWSRPVYHLYPVRVSQRDVLLNHLAEAGIGSGIHYPFPLHLIPPYQAYGFRIGDFPVSERIALEQLSLPLFPGLDRESQERVAAEVMQFACVTQ